MRFLCLLGCGEIEADSLEQIDDHSRVVHPALYALGPDNRWPDGSVSFVDATGEFDAQAQASD